MRAVIDDGADVFTFINTFTAAPDKQDAVIASLRRFTQMHARHLPGFIATAVHTSADQHRVVNYVQWKTMADLRRMMETDAAKAHVAEVGMLAEHVEPIVYRVAFVSSNERAAQ